MHFPSRRKSSSQHLYTLGESLMDTPSPRKETIQDPQLWDDSQHRFSKGRGSAGRQRQGQQLSGLELSGLGGPLRDRRHTTLARIIPLVSKHHSEAISRRPETKQQLPGPERNTSGFISSSLDPLVCTVALLLFLFPTQGAHPKPSLLGSDLPPGS